MPKSDQIGRAFEYACIHAFREAFAKLRPVSIVENENYFNDQKAWNGLDSETKAIMRKQAESSIPTLYALEPNITENDGDILILRLQSDREGVVGDVRDILLIREEKNWSIGISVKHNHFAVKHSRLSSVLDFGKAWVNVPCSDTYWKEIEPIFQLLKENKHKVKWSELDGKSEKVYKPLLEAFKKELIFINQTHKNIPSLLVEYLLGKYDFYKIIGLDKKNITQLIAFNIHGNLNKASTSTEPQRKIPKSFLPTRIVSLEFKPKKDNTLELYMDNGWQFSFRIHNASTLVEPSLKFDVQIIGMPSSIVVINCPW